MSNWVAVEDPVSGRTYYANLITQESSWTLPIESNDDQHSTENDNDHKNTNSIPSHDHDTNYSSQFTTTRRNTIQSMVHFDAVWDSDGVSEGGDSWNDSDSDSSSNDGLLTHKTNKLTSTNTDNKTQGQLQSIDTKPTPNTPNTPNETVNNESIHTYPTPEIITSNNEYWECTECLYHNNINYAICKVCHVPKIKKHSNDSSEGQEKNIILNNDMIDDSNECNYDIPYDLIDLLNKNKTNKFMLENSAFQDSSDDDINENENEYEGWNDVNHKQLFSEIMALIDNNSTSISQNMPNIITSFATDNNNNYNQSHGNSGDNNRNNNENYNESNDNNSYNHSGNSGGNGNGNGGRRNNNNNRDNDGNKKYFNFDSSSDKKEEEEEEEEEEKKEELNKNAKEFIPNYNGFNSYKPLKKRTLSPIDEKQIYSDGKICVNKSRIKMNKIIMNSYDPNAKNRVKFNIDIKRDFTKYITENIKETFKSLYIFMDKSLTLQMGQNVFNVFNNQIRIINYGFHHKETNELLYCIIVKKQLEFVSKNKRQWEMISKLFTANDIEQIYNINRQLLPKRIQSLEWKSNVLAQQNIIENKLMNLEQMESIITATAWHKLPVFNYNYNRNRKRMILKLDKPEFIRNLRSFVDINNKLNIHLIPIIMFDNHSKNNTYQIEYLWIVCIDRQNNIHIGISFILNENNMLIVSGIHLNKTFIISQHELISYHSNNSCQCLDSFISNITDLKIGNPDEELNKIKDLTKKFKTISHELSIKNSELDITKNELKRLQMENDKLKAMIEVYNNSSSSQMINSAQSTPELNTNVSSLTSSVPLQSPLYSSSMIVQPNSLHGSIPNMPLLNNNNNNVVGIIQQPIFYPYQMMSNGAVILLPNQVQNNI